jgi:hypothetical protein
MKYSFIFVTSLCLAISFLACSSHPSEQLRLAQVAMDQAIEQQAEKYAYADWNNARQAWNDAQLLITARQYEDAGPLLVRARSRFEKARDIARAKRDDLSREIESMKRTLDSRYGNVKSDLAGLKLQTSKKKTLDETCLGIDKSRQKLNDELGRGLYVEAKSTAQTALRQVFDVEKELSNPKD